MRWKHLILIWNILEQFFIILICSIYHVYNFCPLSWQSWVLYSHCAGPGTGLQRGQIWSLLMGIHLNAPSGAWSEWLSAQQNTHSRAGGPVQGIQEQVTSRGTVMQVELPGSGISIPRPGYRILSLKGSLARDDWSHFLREGKHLVLGEATF